MSFSKGFSTAGHYEHVTFYHANSTHELSLHDLLQYYTPKLYKSQ
jgi:hypothetical protein